MAVKSRVVREDFWSDPSVLKWPAVKRLFFLGLTAVAEDSGCLEREAFGWKCSLFRSPVDTDVGEAQLEAWCDELIAEGKLVPYKKAGREYLFIRNFHRHQKPPHPRRPSIPVPDWVGVEYVGDSERVKYTFHADILASLIEETEDSCTTRSKE